MHDHDYRLAALELAFKLCGQHADVDDVTEVAEKLHDFMTAKHDVTAADGNDVHPEAATPDVQQPVVAPVTQDHAATAPSVTESVVAPAPASAPPVTAPPTVAPAVAANTPASPEEAPAPATDPVQP